MKKQTVERIMFYNATPGIFQKAEVLRLNMTEAEKVLWERLRKKQLGVRFKAQHPIERFIADSCLPAGRFIVTNISWLSRWMVRFTSTKKNMIMEGKLK